MKQLGMNRHYLLWVPNYVRRVPSLAALLVCAVLLALTITPALAQDALVAAPALSDGKAVAYETYFDDVTIDEVVSGDLIVYTGDVTLDEGAVVQGNVVAYAGDIEVNEGAVVDGNVTAWTGDINIDGLVHGSVAGWSGDINLSEYAAVDGDVSAMSGDISRGDDVTIHGNIVQGPRFRWPNAQNPFTGFAAPNAPEAPVAPEAPRLPTLPALTNAVSPIQRFLSFILRILGATIFTGIAAAGVGLVYYARPSLLQQTRANLQENPVYCGIAGAVVLLPLLLVGGLLWVAWCLSPLAVPPLLLALGLALAGLSGVSQLVGERVSRAWNLQFDAAYQTIGGAVVMVGSLALLWALGGCFRPLAWLAGFVLGSMGVGALLLPWLRNLSNGSFGSAASGSGRSGSPGSAAITTIDGSAVARSTTAANGGPVNGGPVDVVIGGQSSTVEDAASTPVAPVQPLASINPAPVQVEVATPQPLGESVVQPTILEQPATSAPDDFTIIKGIGVVLNRRLQEAGITTFAQLAALEPETIAEIFQRPVDWVIDDDIVGQARYFASGGQRN